MQAGIEKLKIKGRVQVIFNPLIQRLPVIAAIKVKLVYATSHMYTAINQAHTAIVFSVCIELQNIMGSFLAGTAVCLQLTI